MTKQSYINNPKQPITITTFANLTDFADSFLSSCFKYYYGKVKLVNPKLQQSVDLKLSKSFLSVKDKGTLIIIDYPNVIYTLYEKYADLHKVVRHFYHFIHSQLTTSHKTRFFIVSKQVIINNINFNIENVFNIGQQLTGKQLDSSYFLNESICVFNIDYRKKISSSTDDLLSWFICINLFAYLLKSGKDPSKGNENSLKKLTLLTNDKQLFDKNLFGLTESERNNNIRIIRDLSLSKLWPNPNTYKYEIIPDPFNSSMVVYFLSKYVIANVNDTQNIECNISLLLESLLMKKTKTAKRYGYYRQNKWPQYNPNFTKKNFTKKRLPNLSYNNINKKQKRIQQSSEFKNCKLSKMRDNQNGLKEYYYLYVFIKYVQLYLNTTTYENEEYGDFFGSYSKQQILEIIS